MSACVHNHDPKDCDKCREAEHQHRTETSAIERRALMRDEFAGRLSALCWQHDHKILDDKTFTERVKALQASHAEAMEKELKLMFEEISR